MKILIAIPRFYPAQTPRAYRWSALATQLANQGQEVHVFTSYHNTCLAEEVWQGVYLHRSGRASLKDLVVASPLLHPEKETSARANRWQQWGEALHRRYLRPLYFPDVYFTWQRTATKAFEQLLADHRFDLIITVALPLSALEWGLRAKAAFPDMKWLADIGDPYARGVAFPSLLYKNRRRRYERWLLTRCDGITVTNRAYQYLLEHQLPELAGRVSVLPHFSDLSPAPSPSSAEGTRHLLYFGRFYPLLRPAEDILTAFVRFLRRLPNDCKWMLDLYGPAGAFLHAKVWKEIGPCARFHGVISRDEIAKKLPESPNIGLIIGNKSGTQLPSKIADMAALQLPILYYYYREDDPGIDYLRTLQYPQLLALKHGEKLSLSRMEALISRPKGHSFPPIPTAHTTAQRILQLLR